jgi:hypothetical protein
MKDRLETCVRSGVEVWEELSSLSAGTVRAWGHSRSVSGDNGWSGITKVEKVFQ